MFHAAEMPASLTILIGLGENSPKTKMFAIVPALFLPVTASACLADSAPAAAPAPKKPPDKAPKGCRACFRMRRLSSRFHLVSNNNRNCQRMDDTARVLSDRLSNRLVLPIELNEYPDEQRHRPHGSNAFRKITPGNPVSSDSSPAGSSAGRKYAVIVSWTIWPRSNDSARPAPKRRSARWRAGADCQQAKTRATRAPRGSAQERMRRSQGFRRRWLGQQRRVPRLLVGTLKAAK